MRGDFTTIWSSIMLRAPAAGALLGQDIVKNAFDRLCRRRNWSWMMRQGIFAPVNMYNTGRVTATNNSTEVTGVGTGWTTDLVGLQFRLNINFPVYDIVAVTSPTTLVISQPWANATQSNSGYEIYRVYYNTPDNFREFVFGTLKDPSNNMRLWSNATQQQFNYYDPQRVQSQLPRAAAFFDFTQTFTGDIQPTFQVVGSGPSPVSTTTFGYNYPENSIFVVEVTTGGTVGNAIYRWRQDQGAWNSGVTTTEFPWDLSNGVQVYWPADTYTLGDVFIIQANARGGQGVPRYELWPHSKVNTYTYPYQYIIDVPPFDTDNPTLPPFFSQDVILEMSLAACAQYPGTDTAKNPYFTVGLYNQHTQRAEQLIAELEKKDDETAMQDLHYQIDEFYQVPWLDGSWNQSHSMGPYFP